MEVHKSYNAQIIERSSTDASFRRRLETDTAAAIGEVTGHSEEFSITDVQRRLLRKLLEKAADDADFRAQLSNDPETAINHLGLDAELKAARSEMAGSDARYWCLTSFLYAGNPD